MLLKLGKHRPCRPVGCSPTPPGKRNFGTYNRELKHGEVHFGKADMDGMTVWIIVYVTRGLWRPRGWDKAGKSIGCLIPLAHLPLVLLFAVLSQNNFQILD